MKTHILLLIGFVLGSALLPTHGALLSHYQLDGNTTDSGSLGADGTLIGTTSYVNDAPGNLTQSLNLAGGTNGSSHYMEANIGSGYDGLEKLTLTLWINLQGTPAENDRLVSNMGTGSAYNSFDLRWGGTRTPTAFKPQLNVNTINTPAVSPETYNADDSWAFIAVTYDSTLGSNRVSFFSGTELAASTLLGTADQSGALDENALFRIGSTPASGSDRTPPAYFSDVRVYDEVLTLGQIDSVRASVIPEPSSLLMVSGAMVALGMMLIRRRG